MGQSQSVSRVGIIKVKKKMEKVRVKELRPAHINRAGDSSSSAGNEILTPGLCVKILKKSLPGTFQCKERQLRRLQMITAKDGKISGRLEKEFVRAMREKEPMKRRHRKEIDSAIGQWKRRIRWNIWNRTNILEKMVMGEIERVAQYGNDGRGIFGLVSRQWKRFRTTKLDSKGLRRGTNYSIEAERGLERAHVVSLSLAQILWENYSGANRISHDDLKVLKRVLNSRDNFQTTCRFVNRVQHVAYDDEISKQVTNPSVGLRLSPGARERLKMIIKVLEKLCCEYPEIRPFCESSIQKLRLLK